MVCLCLLRGQDNDLSLVNGVGVHKTVGVALEDGTSSNSEIVYPKWNGMNISSKNARTILTVPISIELLNVSLLKTVSSIIKTINSETERIREILKS